MEPSRVAIVPGGTSGLGAEIATLLRGRGMRVVTVSRRETADVAGDASSETTVRRAIDLADSLGSTHILVNSAGTGTFAPTGSYGEESVRRMLDANLVAMILFCDALFPRFARDGGTIVNILSTAALYARAGESVYAASKWGARGYTEVLKSEAKGTKARVLSVSPGGMQTPFWPEERAGYMNARAVAETIVEAIVSPVKITDLVIER
jgi:short-subunit dehydrogenase